MSDDLNVYRERFPQLAWKRDQVVVVFQCCGLGGVAFYKQLKSSGTLKPLRNLPGAKQARYSREDVLTLVAEALRPSAP